MSSSKVSRETMIFWLNKAMQEYPKTYSLATDQQEIHSSLKQCLEMALDQEKSFSLDKTYNQASSFLGRVKNLYWIAATSCYFIGLLSYKFTDSGFIFASWIIFGLITIFYGFYTAGENQKKSAITLKEIKNIRRTVEKTDNVNTDNNVEMIHLAAIQQFIPNLDPQATFNPKELRRQGELAPAKPQATQASQLIEASSLNSENSESSQAHDLSSAVLKINMVRNTISPVQEQPAQRSKNRNRGTRRLSEPAQTQQLSTVDEQTQTEERFEFIA